MAQQYISIGTGHSGSFDPETDWFIRSNLPGIVVKENGENYANRAELMQFYEQLDADHALPQNGMVNTYAPGWTSGTKYDPVPPGARAKIDLSFAPSTWITGGKSIRHIITAEEGANEAGPAIEYWPGDTPMDEYYMQFVLAFTPNCLTHDFGGSHRKIGFLNHFGPSNGQIVPVLLTDVGPWHGAYRIDGSGAKRFSLNHGSQPQGRQRQIYGAYDTGAANPTTASQWDQRWGPSDENLSGTDTDFALIGRPLPSEFCVITYYVNRGYFHPTLGLTTGMIKSWFSQYGVAPQLLMLHFRDCRFNLDAQSVRTCWRPENYSIAAGADSGYDLDQLLVMKVTGSVGANGIPHPGLFDLPFPGTAIPPGHPITGTHDSVGD